MASESFKKALNEVDGAIDTMKGLTLKEVKAKINEIEFTRRLSLLTGVRPMAGWTTSRFPRRRP